MILAPLRRALVSGACILSTAAGAAPRATGTLVLPADAAVVAATIDGAPVRLAVAFDAPGVVVLSPRAAARIGVRRRGGATVLVGPVVLPGSSAPATLDIGGARTAVRLLWTGRPPSDDPAVDGIVSPGALPFATVRLERTNAPPARRSGLRATFGVVSGLAARLDGSRIALRLAPQRAETIATAAAGAALIERVGGRLSRAEAPARRIDFGIDRPVALLTLDRPVAVAGRSVARLLVRTADFAGAARLPDAAPAASPDEIVVTGRSAGRARQRLTLGRDVLGGCAAIIWDRAARRILLDCP